MNIDNFQAMRINKNRGWRGLAEVQILGDNDKPERITMKRIFSFSQNVWDDMVYNKIIVVDDVDNYYVVHFSAVVTGRLPDSSNPMQRSVVIKDVVTNISSTTVVPKSDWYKATGDDYKAIWHYASNKNNHTTSDWNCIGVRVLPNI